MTLLSRILPKPAQNALPQTLDGLFAEIGKYGRLSILMQHDNGDWSARIDIPTTNPAIRAELSSGFDKSFKTPHEALKEILRKTKAPA